MEIVLVECLISFFFLLNACLYAGIVNALQYIVESGKR